MASSDVLWLKNHFKPRRKISPFGELVADLLGDLFKGIYHIDRRVLSPKVKWDDSRSIDLIISGELATFDNNLLTNLVILAHCRCVRVSIEGCSSGYLKLGFSARDKDGQDWNRHPSIKEFSADINALTSGQSEASRVLLTAECAELGIEFVCVPEFGFVTQGYPDDPFKSLASLIMLERVQSWLELDSEAASSLMIALYPSDSSNLSSLETERQFSMRMAWAIIETSKIKELVIHKEIWTDDEIKKLSQRGQVEFKVQHN